MKKITIALVMLLGSFSMASAELGVNLGVSGQIGVFEATAVEHEGSTTAADRERSGKDDVMGAFGYGSIFIEKTLGRIAIGVDYVPDGLESDTSSTTRPDITTLAAGGTSADVINKVQVAFEDLTTFYVNVMVSENFYLTAGAVSVDVKTKESLGTGSTYGDTDLSGSVFGFGYHHAFDNGMFVRTSASVIEFDGTTMESANKENMIVLDQLNGASGKISIGKTF
tara:strand:- start:124 stop:798 length:675 start_codon:yes stop_codon:yes gene_type:complete